MDKIELKNLLFLARINAKEEEYPELIKKLQNTFVLIDEMQDLDLSDLEPLNNPLEISNVSREDINKNRNNCLLYTSPSPRDDELSRMPSSA